MEADTLSHFGLLDELTQVVYQGLEKFVVLSNVDDYKWSIHLGLAGQEGRWWRGSWSENDIRQVAGQKPSAKYLEGFADNLLHTFLNGELHVEHWGEDDGADIKLRFGSSSKKPLHMSLVELTPEEAASHATTVFFDIALQAQSRKCRLNPPSFAPSSVMGPLPTVKIKAPEDVNLKTKAPAHSTTETASRSEQDALLKVKNLEAQLAKEQNKKKSKSPTGESSSQPKRPLKGASLANPNKKARKVVELEFGSDD